MQCEKNLSCRSCVDQNTKNLCIAHCLGCRDVFCVEHLIEHRRNLTDEINQLIERHDKLKKKCLEEQFQLIEQWEIEMIEWIRRHTNEVKEKIFEMYEQGEIQWKERHENLEKDLQEKRDSNRFFERELIDITQQIEQLENEIEQQSQFLQQITVEELNQFIPTYKPNTTIEKSFQWNYLYQIQLDSTYGYMAANDQQIFLGWKSRIVIYNLDGTKHDQTRLQSLDIYGELCDIVWSSTMEMFFILCRKALFIHQPSRSQIEPISSISLVNQDNQYISITSFPKHLALLNEQTLELWKYSNMTFDLISSIVISNLLKNPLDEHIVSIRANEDHLAVLIQIHSTHSWRIDLYNLFPFRRRHFGISFDQYEQINLGVFISLEKNTYLFMNWETKFMQMIADNGVNELIDSQAYNACLVGTQRKLIVNYMTHLKVYDFEKLSKNTD